MARHAGTRQAATAELRLPPTPCIALGDAHKIRQILLNLLGNAVKLTPRGGRIVVDVGSRSGTPHVTYLRVGDTGIGVPRVRQPEIVDPFVQAHRSLTQPTEGTGLGSAISRDLAPGMGGDLRVRSTEGVGSTFTLTLRRHGGVADAGEVTNAGERRTSDAPQRGADDRDGDGVRTDGGASGAPGDGAG